MILPLNKTVVGYTSDSDSFRHIDINTQLEIPTGNHVGAFGYVRKNHTHEGIDLYGYENDLVFSMFDGTIVKTGWFTGEPSGSPWWMDTQFVMIETEHGIINYGEMALEGSRTVGDSVSAGDMIGRLKPVLKTDKGRPTTMLHMELYDRIIEPVEWNVGEPKPDGLLDPTVLFALSE